MFNRDYSTLMVLENCFAFSLFGSVTYKMPFSYRAFMPLVQEYNLQESVMVTLKI